MSGSGTEYACGWDFGAGECRTGEVTDDREREALFEARPGACSHYTAAPTASPSLPLLPLQLRFDGDFNILFPLASRAVKIDTFKSSATNMIKLATGSNVAPNLIVSEGSVLLTVNYGDRDLQDNLASAAAACTLSMVFNGTQMRPSLTGPGARNCNAEAAASETRNANAFSSTFWWIIVAVAGGLLLIWLGVHIKLAKKKGSAKVNPDNAGAGSLGMPVLPAPSHSKGLRSSSKRNSVVPQEQMQEQTQALSNEDKVAEALMDLDSDPTARSKINAILADELYLELGTEDPDNSVDGDGDAYLNAHLDLYGAKKAAVEIHERLKSENSMVDLVAENCLEASQGHVEQLEQELADIKGNMALSDDEIARQLCAAKIRLRLAQDALKRQQNLKDALIRHDRLTKQLINTHTPLEEQDMARAERTALMVEAAEDNEAACQENVDLLEKELADIEVDSSLSDDEIARRARAAKMRLRLAREDLLRQQQLRLELILQSKLAQQMIDAHHLVVDTETEAAATLLADHVAVMEADFKALSFEPSDTASFFGSLRHQQRTSLDNAARLSSSSPGGQFPFGVVTSDSVDRMLDEKVTACRAIIEKLENEIIDVESDDSFSDAEINQRALAARMRLRLAKAELYRQEQLRMELIMRNKLAQKLVLLTKSQAKGSLAQRREDGTRADLNEEIEAQRLYLAEQLPDQRADADKIAADVAEAEVSRLEDELRSSALSSKDTAALERRLQVERLQLRLARDRAKRARLAQMQAHLRNRSLQKFAAANKTSNDAEEEVQLLSEMLEETEGLASAEVEVAALLSECQRLLPGDGPAVNSVGDGSLNDQHKTQNSTLNSLRALDVSSRRELFDLHRGAVEPVTADQLAAIGGGDDIKLHAAQVEHVDSELRQRQLTAAQLKLQSARKRAKLHRKKQLEAKLRLRQIAVLSASTINEDVMQQSDAAFAQSALLTVEEQGGSLIGVAESPRATSVDMAPQNDTDDLSVAAIQSRVRAAKLRQRVAANRAGREAEIQRELRLHQKLTDDLVKTSELAARHVADEVSLDVEFARLSKARYQALSQDQPVQEIDVELEQVASKLQLASERALYCQSVAADTAAKMAPMLSGVEAQVQLVAGEEKDDLIGAMEILQGVKKFRGESTQQQDTATAEDVWETAKKAIRTGFSAELEQLAVDEYAVRVAKTDAQTSLALQERDGAELELKQIESETSPSDQSELETRIKVARLRVRLAKQRAQKAQEASKQRRGRERLVSRLVATEKQVEKAQEIERLIAQTMESPGTETQTDELTARLALAHERAIFAEERRASLLGELSLASDADTDFESTNAAEMLAALDALEEAEDPPHDRPSLFDSSSDDDANGLANAEEPELLVEGVRPNTATSRPGTAGSRTPLGEAAQRKQAVRLAKKRELAQKRAERTTGENMRRKIHMQVVHKARAEASQHLKTAIQQELTSAIDVAVSTSNGSSSTRRRSSLVTSVAGDGFMKSSSDTRLERRKTAQTATHKRLMAATSVADDAKRAWLKVSTAANRSAKKSNQSVRGPDSTSLKIAEVRKNLVLEMVAELQKQHETEVQREAANAGKARIAAERREQDVQASEAEAKTQRNESERINKMVNQALLNLAGIADPGTTPKRRWSRHRESSAVGALKQWRRQQRRACSDVGTVLEVQAKKNKNMGALVLQMKESTHIQQKNLASLMDFSTENPWASAGDELEVEFRGVPRRRSAIERGKNSPAVNNPEQPPPTYPMNVPFDAAQSPPPVAPNQLPALRNAGRLPPGRPAVILPALRGPGAGPRDEATVLHDDR